MKNIEDDFGCPFEHDNIDVLYGVTEMPVEQLPKFCVCGAPLTYADEVIFISFPEIEEVDNGFYKIERVELEE